MPGPAHVEAIRHIPPQQDTAVVQEIAGLPSDRAVNDELYSPSDEHQDRQEEKKKITGRWWVKNPFTVTGMEQYTDLKGRKLTRLTKVHFDKGEQILVEESREFVGNHLPTGQVIGGWYPNYVIINLYNGKKAYVTKEQMEKIVGGKLRRDKVSRKPIKEKLQTQDIEKNIHVFAWKNTYGQYAPYQIDAAWNWKKRIPKGARLIIAEPHKDLKTNHYGKWVRVKYKGEIWWVNKNHLSLSPPISDNVLKHQYQITQGYELYKQYKQQDPTKFAFLGALHNQTEALKPPVGNTVTETMRKHPNYSTKPKG